MRRGIQKVALGQGMHCSHECCFGFASESQNRVPQRVEFFVEMSVNFHVLTKSPRDVILCQLFIGRGEHLFSRVYFYELAEQEERSQVGYARRLLHIMRHDDNRVLLL